MTKTYAPGSKIDKLVKTFEAMYAIARLSPTCGGLTGDLQDAYQIIYKKFIEAATACDLSEVDALVLATDYVTIKKD